MESFVKFIVDMVGNWGYPGIIIMMTIESSFIPFPSEAVMIPAGYLAQQGKMSLPLAIISGVFGSMLGAYFNYYLSIWLGRPVLIKVAGWFGISEKKFNKVDIFFHNHGEITTFVGRLIPYVRQIISCPAGLARMNIAKFSIYTAAGAGLWVTVLAFLGYFIGEIVGKNRELLKQYSRQYSWQITIVLLIFCALIVAIYVHIKHRRARAEKLAETAKAQAVKNS
ncbi:MAG: DedA family protein [Candidatus Sumerlaeota bacterium]|nr:DedA family protein [Candidatus Sumerlaeota bacterium]